MYGLKHIDIKLYVTRDITSKEALPFEKKSIE